VHNPLLKGLNAARADIDQPWEQDNQQWWEWYVSLASDPGATPDDRDPLTLRRWQAQNTARLDLGRLQRELATRYEVSDAQRQAFRHHGYIKLKQLVSAEALATLRHQLTQRLEATFGAPLDGGYRDRFLSLEMVWLDDPVVQAFVNSPRLCGVVADLLGVPGLRLYHDNVLSKEPGCGRTPWHYDDHHFPLATRDVATIWIPTQPIPETMGPLTFASPITAWELTQSIPFDKFGTSYDAQVDAMFRDHGVVIDDSGFDLGEVSIHHNLNFHSAGANHTEISRLALANTYFVDGARVVDAPTMVSGDWQKFMPGVGPGAVVESPFNPVVWPKGIES
jgi:ectoine hydroxylase-related dioxygenase (phytanoyl-CoA dioxygenase family)